MSESDNFDFFDDLNNYVDSLFSKYEGSGQQDNDLQDIKKSSVNTSAEPNSLICEKAKEPYHYRHEHLPEKQESNWVGFFLLKGFLLLVILIVSYIFILPMINTYKLVFLGADAVSNFDRMFENAENKVSKVVESDDQPYIDYKRNGVNEVETFAGQAIKTPINGIVTQWSPLKIEGPYNTVIIDNCESDLELGTIVPSGMTVCYSYGNKVNISLIDNATGKTVPLQ